jgi:casein kinase II subunit beta
VSSESEDSTAYWIEWFLSLKGNEFFCEIDEDYILDRFNLVGLYSEVPHYKQAFDLITDALDTEEYTEDTYGTQFWDEIEASARHLYGLIHARFILTGKGLAKMEEKFKLAEFGKCPRVLCQNQPVLPTGLLDQPGQKGLKLYCPHCEDVYTPPSRRHSSIDGAFFGTSFPHLFLQAFPEHLPKKRSERYVPKIFGFKLHSAMKEIQEQNEIRKEQNEFLKRNSIL